MRRHGTPSRLGFWRACLFPLREPSLSQACHWSAPEYPATVGFPGPDPETPGALSEPGTGWGRGEPDLPGLGALGGLL